MVSTLTQKLLVEAGEQWAAQRHAAGAPSSWVATWQEAVRLGIAPDDSRHESAKLCAASARAVWHQLRLDAPPLPQRTRKSRSGPSGPNLSEARRRELGKGRLYIRGLDDTWVARFDALCKRAEHTRAEHLKGMIEEEEAEQAEIDAQNAKNPPPVRED
jgi:hypothetical protein